MVLIVVGNWERWVDVCELGVWVLVIFNCWNYFCEGFMLIFFLYKFLNYYLFVVVLLFDGMVIRNGDDNVDSVG